MSPARCNSEGCRPARALPPRARLDPGNKPGWQPQPAPQRGVSGFLGVSSGPCRRAGLEARFLTPNLPHLRNQVLPLRHLPFRSASPALLPSSLLPAPPPRFPVHLLPPWNRPSPPLGRVLVRSSGFGYSCPQWTMETKGPSLSREPPRTEGPKLGVQELWGDLAGRVRTLEFSPPAHQVLLLATASWPCGGPEAPSSGQPGSCSPGACGRRAAAEQTLPATETRLETAER